MNRHALRNDHGMRVGVLARGGIIDSIVVPDRAGRAADVALGYDTPEGWADNRSYFGAIVGRYANRIARGRFTLDGVEYALATNNAPNHLHGGVVGFDQATWRMRRTDSAEGEAVELTHVSPDGDEGYPGTLRARVVYTVRTRENALVVDFEAATDRPTHVNLTQHTYLNLAGHDAGDVLDHVLEIAADRFLPVDETLIPTGERRAVAGTPFDFRRATPIGERIGADDAQLRIGHGYDHTLVLADAMRTDPAFAARVHEPTSGRTLTVETTEPGVQLYTGNWLGGIQGKGDALYRPRSGFALETQHWPDSPNKPDFPSTVLRPGRSYRSRTVYAFGVA